MQINSFYKISWNTINLFLQCQSCFYNDQVLGIKRPKIDPESFKLYKRIDESLKEELNLFRRWGKPHPIMVKNNIDAIPFNDESNSIERWQNSFEGIQFYDSNNKVLLFSGIDDLWINSSNELIIVEYKTSSTEPGESIQQNSWYQNYRLQISFYAWLFKMNGFTVNNFGCFIYCNAIKNNSTFLPFNKKLEFEVNVSFCEINNSWVEGTIIEMINCLNLSQPPKLNKFCKYCNFVYKTILLKTTGYEKKIHFS